MKVGNLVYFSNKHLCYDYERLRGQYGVLLEQIDIPNGTYVVRGWRALFDEKIIFLYENDISPA